MEVESLGLPAYFLTGTETDPTAPGSDFKANWWYATSHEIVKQASDFPDIAFGTASIHRPTTNCRIIFVLQLYYVACMLRI